MQPYIPLKDLVFDMRDQTWYFKNERILAEAHARALEKVVRGKKKPVVEAVWEIADVQWGYLSNQPCRR